MKRHLIAELDRLSEADLGRILDLALLQAQMLDGPSPWEDKLKTKIYDLIWCLDRPEK